MANFVCFLAARAAKAGWDVRERRARRDSGRRLRVYASAETHTWIQKAADLFGFGTDADPLDSDRRAAAHGRRRAAPADRGGPRARRSCRSWSSAPPGSVSTGAVDPLPEIAASAGSTTSGSTWTAPTAACRGASRSARRPARAGRGRFGRRGSAQVAVRAARGRLRSGARSGGAARRVLVSPAVLPLRRAGVNFVDYGPQNSRGFRALKVWLALQHIGRAGYAE